jgi:plastocyanin domain-containing protein
MLAVGCATSSQATPLAVDNSVATVAAKPAPAASQPAIIEINVTKRGFEPADIKVTKGQPVVLAFTRTEEHTCAKDVVVQIGDGKTETRVLPLNERVVIALTFAKTGELGYACKMDMVTGIITVQ